MPAAFIGVRLYRTNLDLFDDWGRANGGNLTVALQKLKGFVQGAGRVPMRSGVQDRSATLLVATRHRLRPG